MQQIQLLQAVSAQIGPDALRQLLQALGTQQQASAPAPAPPTYPPAQIGSALGQNVASYAGSGGHVPQNGQGYGRDDTGAGARERSRSPDWNRSRFSPPRRRDSPTYGTYDPGAPAGSNGRGQDDRGRRGRRGGGTTRNDYRQRSPAPAMRDARESPVPHTAQPKPIAYDNKLREGHIKGTMPTTDLREVNSNSGCSAQQNPLCWRSPVIFCFVKSWFDYTVLTWVCRTSEAELKAFFRQFGGVQSCIVNQEKRHAFLKLVSHQDAMATRQAVWNLPETEYRSLFERVSISHGLVRDS
jgi:protein NRD1